VFLESVVKTKFFKLLNFLKIQFQVDDDNEEAEAMIRAIESGDIDIASQVTTTTTTTKT